MTERVTLDLTQHEMSGGADGAYRLSNTGKIRDAKWIPKSLCEKLAEGKYRIEAWKAKDVGFVQSDVGQGSLL